MYDRFPGEVVITDVPTDAPSNSTATPADEANDDFFSSWDKPTIKRPSNPPSRTGTPSTNSRAASPFLTANQNGTNAAGRPKSPSLLASATATAAANGNQSGDNETGPPPAVVRSSSSTTATAGKEVGSTTAPRRTNILGAKKGQKLGAKKVTGEEIDFEAMEKKARDEAERIEKLGYDPEAEKRDEAAAAAAAAATAGGDKDSRSAVDAKSAIASPTPTSPNRSNKSHQRSPSEIERLGMGMNRLGFGQVNSAKGAAAAGPKKMGFGAVGTKKVGKF